MTTAIAAAGAGRRPECSDQADPLSRYSLISLFPRTFGILRDAPRPYDLGSDLDSIHDHLASAASRSTELLLEQARAIVEKKSEILNDDDIAKRKRRRQGLPSHLKAQRPRFSLKPDFTSQSAVNLLANLEFDVDKYEDPEELFDAYEKFETAKRELQKLAGLVPDLDQRGLPANGRPRRPGLSRSRVSYNHLFKDITLSPQRTCQKDATSTESPLSALQPERIEPVMPVDSAVIVGAENNASAPSDDVFSSIFEDLDIDGADVFDVLQERLQIKTFDVKSLHILDMQELQHNEVKTPGSDSSKLRSADSQNIWNSVPSKSSSKHGRVVGSQLSPTPPKSPSNVMNLLRKPLAEISSLIVPGSPGDLEAPIQGIPQPTVCSESESPNPSKGNYSRFAAKSQLKVAEEVGDALCDIPQPVNFVEKTRHISGKDSSDGYGGAEPNVNIGSVQMNMEKDEDIASLAGINNSDSILWMEGANAGLRDKRVDVGDDMNTESTVIGAVGRLNIEECDVNSLSQMEVQIESPILRPSEESRKPDESLTTNTSGRMAKENQEKKKNSLTKGRKGKRGRDRKQTADSAGQTSAVEQNLNVTEDTVPGESPVNPKEHEEVIPEESLADQKKEGDHDRRCKAHRRKDRTRRQSLAAAGTSWTGGVRRSTRIKSRPLEYWKGERFLYGRVHQTLATAIGIKYESPGKADGRPSFRVKSFVSDQYKDLVDLVSLH